MKGSQLGCLRPVRLGSGASLGIGKHNECLMAENAVVRARIDEVTKVEAAAVLAAMGLSLSDAFRMLLKRVAAEKALPFDPLAPNAETIAAMKAARRGDVVVVGAAESLLNHFNADD